MKTSFYPFFFLLISVFITGCATYKHQNSYPAFYINKISDTNGLMSSSQLPNELIESLPVEFQLANYSGHLWCFRDDFGSTKPFPLVKSIRKIKSGSKFRAILSLALNDIRFKVYKPIGYPQVFCVMPNVKIEQLFDETWFGSWLSYFTLWEIVEFENQRLQETYNCLNVQVSNLGDAIKQIEESIKVTEVKIQEMNVSIKNIESLIESRKQSIEKAQSIDIDLKTQELPPFNLQIEYLIENDPFIEVVKNLSTEIKEDWASDQMEGGKFLDSELINKIQEINKAFNNLDTVKNEGLKKEMEELVNNDFKGIIVNSGTRTPYKQACLYAISKKNKNPVGKYVSSAHMFGQAADLSIPNSWKKNLKEGQNAWSLPLHEKLRNVLNKWGVSMPTINDPVHFTLSKPSNAFYTRRLIMVRAYLAKATEIKQEQNAIGKNLIFIKNKAIEQKTKLESDLNKKNQELTKLTTLFSQLSAGYYSKLVELQQIDAEILRKKNEADRLRDRNDRFERKEPHSLPHFPVTPKPIPDKPQKDPLPDKPTKPRDLG